MEKMYYTVARVNSIEEINWDQIPKAEISSYRWGDPTVIPAYGQLVYVEGCGLVAHLVAQEEPEIKYHKDGDPVYQDCALEFFLQLGPEGYINCETNAVGARLQEFGQTNSGRKMIVLTDDNFPVEAEKAGDSWSVTITMPLETLKVYYPELQETYFYAGRTFRGNFYKIHEASALETSHFGMWQEIENDFPQFHMPDQFGNFVLE